MAFHVYCKEYPPYCLGPYIYLSTAEQELASLLRQHTVACTLRLTRWEIYLITDNIKWTTLKQLHNHQFVRTHPEYLPDAQTKWWRIWETTEDGIYRGRVGK